MFGKCTSKITNSIGGLRTDDHPVDGLARTREEQKFHVASDLGQLTTTDCTLKSVWMLLKKNENFVGRTFRVDEMK